MQLRKPSIVSSTAPSLLVLGIVAVLTGCSPTLKMTQTGNRQLPLSVAIPAKHTAEITITRVVHASVLIEYGGQALLTDPWFTETKEYPPSEKLGLALNALPALTAITSTMDHYDHFDLEGIKNSALTKVPLVIPSGTKQHAKALAAGLSDVRAVNEGETVTIGVFKITAVKARDNTKPTAFDYETAWKIEAGDWKILVVGHRISTSLARAAGPVDIALLPVNDLRIKPVFKQLSLSPAEAAEVARAAGAPLAIPDHYMYRSSWLWETFVVSHHGTAQAFSEAFRAAGGNGVVLPAGGQLVITGSAK
ncbi:MBL fold metallo-hydrolase [Hymenobacter sp. BT664]|uniref:MBL fold metallo-hydrolase n=1 Tax=Hymenobacter montanus TaxID=2771359 RepID=A0A927BEI9_9BACT|nr:MBL fold metallo-hydrolase [Hymenobacter montanus]MBD2769401.1 MBL fold metallo-hydrolase [Hymenobacter montanus]